MAENKTSNYFALQGSVHIVGFAEYTVCGFAMEGEDGDAEGMYVVPQKVTCERCIEVIEYVKTIPNKHHRARRRRHG